MKKVFAFIGSPLKTQSNTAALTRIMLERLVTMDAAIEYELVIAGQVRLEYCRGCWSCMTRGSCPVDARDDMGGLRQRMLAADFVIFGSPVYTCSVSGPMKTFLDRLCAWYHTLRLAGKPGMTVVTTAADGQTPTFELLEMLLAVLGVHTVARLEAFAYTPGFFRDPEAARAAALEAAQQIFPWVSGELRVQSDSRAEAAFQAMKAKSTLGREWLPADYAYWEQSGMLSMNSYAELLEALRSRAVSPPEVGLEPPKVRAAPLTDA